MPTTAPATLMDRLKAETRAAHEATEAIPFSAAMMQKRLPSERFVAKLAAYLPVHRALEDSLRQAEHAAVRAVWGEDLAKTHLLERDLACFEASGADRAAAPSAAMAAGADFAAWIEETARRQPAALLGVLYVLEGSTLGAAILRRPLAEAFGLEGDDGLSYYSPYGPSPMPHWQEFRGRMNAAVTDPDEQDAVVAGANEAFRRVGEILKALSDGL